MATKKKTKVAPVTDIVPSLGDHVSVVTATIFDNDGNLSDLLATGTITNIDPEPGWDYEVTFDGVLSLDGRGDIKTRLYNKHQIAKTTKALEIPPEVSTGMHDVLRLEFEAVDNYNRCVRNIVEVSKELTRAQSSDRLLRLYSERNRYYSMLPDEAKKVKDARKKLADAIRLLLAENPDDKTPV